MDKLHNIIDSIDDVVCGIASQVGLETPFVFTEEDQNSIFEDVEDIKDKLRQMSKELKGNEDGLYKKENDYWGV